MYKNLAEFNGQGQRSKVKIARDKKNEKLLESSPLRVHSRVCAVARPQQTIPLRGHPGVTGLACELCKND